MATIAQALSIALAHHQAGRLEVAEGIYRQILAAAPNHAEAWHLLGVAAHQRGQHQAAIEFLGQAIARQPADARYHNNLGQAQHALHRDAEAIACYRRAVELAPDFAVAHNNLGGLLRAAGKLEEAVACYGRALDANPRYAEAWNNLANARHEQQQLPAAVDAYRRALELNPRLAQTYCNLGLVLLQLGHPDEAATCCGQAIGLRPDLAEAHFGLANAHRALDRTDEAVSGYRRALELRPDDAETLGNLAGTLKDQGRLAEALDAYRRGVQWHPDDAAAHSNLVYMLHFVPGEDAASLGAAQRGWDACHGVPRQRFIVPHANDRTPDRRLRVGYVSPDFRHHAQSLFTTPLFSAHDHGQFEIFAYAAVPRPDAVTERLRGLCDVWRDIAALDEPQVTAQIRHDQVDILVDLTMHMAGNRLPVFARKPAPVQVSWLAYPGTTGLSAIDYRLTDRFLDPPGLGDEHYTETSLRLPDSFWCYAPLETELAVGRPPAADRGYVTFGSLNTFCKVHAELLRRWAAVLRHVERSRLLLMAPAGSPRQRVLQLLAQEGVASDRITFVGERPRAEYLALYHEIDLALDTFPYNGHTTSLDSLWMGVPVVSLAGRTAVGRGGLSILSHVGLPELVAHDAEQYVQLAIELANDPLRLAALRATLRDRLRSSPLMDAPRFARSVETAYRQMWHHWCNRPTR
jgi:predicted O-linked N-acetylglucosamine transferase (SPINDLY family)